MPFKQKSHFPFSEMAFLLHQFYNYCLAIFMASVVV
jgi:hypothetical protein